MAWMKSIISSISIPRRKASHSAWVKLTDVVDSKAFEQLFIDLLAHLHNALDIRHLVKESNLELRRREADNRSAPLSSSERVDILHGEAIEELIGHAVVEELPDIEDLISSHVVENTLECNTVEVHDVSLPLRRGCTFPGSITETSEVGEKVFVAHFLHHFNDLVVVIHFVECELDLISTHTLEILNIDLLGLLE